ncbi:unnamed protein product [Brachionus calyciflorus]|uniref:Palmitoyltransferase n=1 Tax=Brachionus calyciflorus TaxID=104777 RepID=A0A813QN41_9BILA|nr:unnamed protein product [Brachionus calyciflorus]
MTNNPYYDYDLNNDDDDYEPCSKKLLPSLFAWFLLISSSSSYFTLVFPLYFDLIGRFDLFILAAVGHGLIFIYVLINFSIATFMDPGRLPKIEVSDNGEGMSKPLSSTNYKNALINDINVRMKWCTTCQFYRPPRSSHCAVCNACIDTMDHHCPWVSNCIGRRNYKYFFSFLVSLTIHMLLILSLCITLVLLNKENLANIPMAAAILLIILISVLIIPIGGLTGFHIILVSRGRTTNEQVTGKFRTGVNPFDQGLFKNCAKVLFSSNPPSYIEFKRKQAQLREYYQTKILLQYSNNQKIKHNEFMTKNGQIVKGGNSAKIITPQRYKNPNFQKNTKTEHKRVRNYQVNNHEHNELELKYNNQLNQHVNNSNYSNNISRSQNHKKNNYTNYDNHKPPQRYTRNHSYTNAANQNLVENMNLIPHDFMYNTNNMVPNNNNRDYYSNNNNKKQKYSNGQMRSNENKKFRETNGGGGGYEYGNDRTDYDSYEITV